MRWRLVERGRAEFLWPQPRTLQSLKCSAVSTQANFGHVADEIKQQDMSAFSNQRDRQPTICMSFHLSPSFTIFSDPSLGRAVCHSNRCTDDPACVSIFDPLCLSVASWCWHLRLPSSITGLTVGPKWDGPVIWIL